MWCCICMGKTNAKYVFSKNPCVFRILNNFVKKTWTKTQSLLEVFITKHCFLQYICCVHRKHENTAASGWKYTFLRVNIGKNEARNARGRGVGALLLLLLLLLLLVFLVTNKLTIFRGKANLLFIHRITRLTFASELNDNYLYIRINHLSVNKNQEPMD